MSPALELLLAFGVVLVAVILLVVLQGRRRQVVGGATGASHGAATGLLVLLAMAPISWVWGLWVGDSRLPVERPESPGGMGCADNDPVPLLTALLVLAIFCAAMRGIPFLIGFLIDWLRNRRHPHGALPDGRLALRATAAASVVISGLVLVRLLMGGTAPEAFTTYGAITPEQAEGWRVDWTIDRATEGGLRPLEDGPPIETEARPAPSSHMAIPSSGWRVVDGAKIWVGGEPMLVSSPDGGPPLLRPVAHRSEFPHARRAHFETRPQIAPASDGWLLVEERADGSRFAVLVGEDGGERAATIAHAGLLLAPPLWPLVGSLPFVVIIALLGWRLRGDAHRPLSRLTAAWLLAELAIFWLAAYRPYI